VDFELNSGKTGFLEFSRKEAVFGKTNYSPFSFSLGPIYEQNKREIDCRYSFLDNLLNGLLAERGEARGYV